MSLSKLSSFYRRLVTNHLLVVQSVQTATLMAFGDCIAQTYVEGTRLRDVNLVRTGQFALVGLLFVGPSLSTWYRFLARNVDESKQFWVVKKVAMDQLLFAPLFVPAFLTVLNLVEGQSLDETQRQIRSKYVDVMLTNYMIWPATQLVNFYFMPLRHQVLLAQIVAVFWNTYLSWKSAQGKKW